MRASARNECPTIKAPISPAAIITWAPRFDPRMSSGPTAATVGTFGAFVADALRDGTARAEPATCTRLVAVGATARAPSAREAFTIP